MFHVHRRLSRANSKAQRGVVAIEFALLFPVFFLIFYAITTYGLIFATQQSIALAAAEGGRAAIRYPAQPTSYADSVNKRLAQACAASRSALSWLQGMGGLGSGSDCSGPDSAPGVHASSATCSYTSAGASLLCVTVTVNYDYQTFPLVPHLLGDFIKLPTPGRLVGRAVVQVNPEYAL